MQLFAKLHRHNLQVLFQCSISNDFSFNLSYCWCKVCISTFPPFTDLQLNCFLSKNSNHRSIEIEFLHTYFHCEQWNYFGMIAAYNHFWRSRLTAIYIALNSDNVRVFAVTRLSWNYPEVFCLALLATSQLRMETIRTRSPPIFPVPRWSNIYPLLGISVLPVSRVKFSAFRLSDFVSLIFIIQSLYCYQAYTYTDLLLLTVLLNW